MSLPKNEELAKQIATMQNEIAKLKSELATKPNVKTIFNCDLNELPNEGTGIFIAYSQVKNAPDNRSTVHFYVNQIVYSLSRYVIQYATCLHSDKKLYIRRKVEGTWEEWTAV